MPIEIRAIRPLPDGGILLGGIFRQVTAAEEAMRDKAAKQRCGILGRNTVECIRKDPESAQTSVVAQIDSIVAVDDLTFDVKTKGPAVNLVLSP